MTVRRSRIQVVVVVYSESDAEISTSERNEGTKANSMNDLWP